MTAEASHPAAYIGCARHCKIGECIKPNQENTDAIRHQMAARPKFRSIISVISALTTSTRNYLAYIGSLGGRIGGPIGGKACTPAKRRAARRNGKLGGRPRKFVEGDVIELGEKRKEG